MRRNQLDRRVDAMRAVARFLVVGALCAIWLVPAESLAATAKTQIKRVWYTAGTAETNVLVISVSGADYSLTDQGATIVGEPLCTASGGTATCPGGGIIGITVSAGDGSDSVTNTTPTPSTLSGGDGNDSLEGGSGNDILRGNKGVDTHAGGAGDDFIDVRGDRADIVSCGDGSDTVLADGTDSVAPDCESVDRGGAPPPPPPGPTTGPSPSVEVILGPVEADTLGRGACTKDGHGTAAGDRLAGTALGDNLFGLQGNDVLKGMRGDDCLFGGLGSDRLIGAQGDDRLLGDDRGVGIAGNDRLFGNGGDDLLAGGPGRDLLVGGAGADRLSAGRGRNRVLAGSGNDQLNSANGSFDRVGCGGGRDTVVADRVDRLRGCERARLRG
jgi:Ca2+-binding RTX toxin-like protein